MRDLQIVGSNTQKLESLYIWRKTQERDARKNYAAGLASGLSSSSQEADLRP